MTDEAMSPSRRRMIEDVTIRKFAPKTQHDYVQRIKRECRLMRCTCGDYACVLSPIRTRGCGCG